MSILRRPPGVPGSTHFGDLAYDLLNFGRNSIIFHDHHPMREVGGRTQFPNPIIVPPGCMAAIPDEYYLGKTDDGKDNNQCTRYYGKNRPLRKVVNGVSFFDPDVYKMPERWLAAHAARAK